MTKPSPPAAEVPFFVTGGTMRQDSASYVIRRADQALWEGLNSGQFCYVLTSRQLGKSSLMVRTVARLRAEGSKVAVLDLSALGQNLTPEQWYDGLISRLGQQLDLEDALEDFWQEAERLPPMQRFFRALGEVVIPAIHAPVVIFIDEIDAVLSLPFSVDEFFSGIRAVYNRRTEDIRFEHVSFCLLGVATPSDLIRDSRTTPFNIGRRIELDDFTLEEALKLAHGLFLPGVLSLEQGEALVRRVHFWTHGHPYLTQRLCQTLKERGPGEAKRGRKAVDACCSALFLDSRSREKDDNLQFVRHRILQGTRDLAGLLELYRRIHRGRRVPDDDLNPLITTLRLAGIVRTEGRLVVRNRIYARVFDAHWIREVMPDAELQRQRAAFRRGLLQASAMGLGVLGVVGWLAFLAQRDATRAVIGEHRAQEQAALANRRGLEAEAATKKARDEATRATEAELRAQNEAARAQAARNEALTAQAMAEAASLRANAQANLAAQNAERARRSELEARSQAARGLDLLRLLGSLELLPIDPSMAAAFLKEVAHPEDHVRWKEGAQNVLASPLYAYALEGGHPRHVAGAVCPAGLLALVADEKGGMVALDGQGRRSLVYPRASSAPRQMQCLDDAGTVLALNDGGLEALLPGEHAPRPVVEGPTFSRFSVASEDGHYVLAATDGSLRVGNLDAIRSGAEHNRVAPADGRVQTALSAQVPLSRDRTLEPGGKTVLPQSHSAVVGLGWIAGGILAASVDGAVRWWDSRAAGPPRVLEERDSRPLLVAFSVADQGAVVTFEDGTVRSIAFPGGQVSSLQGPKERVTTLSVLTHGGALVGTVRGQLLRLTADRPPEPLPCHHRKGVTWLRPLPGRTGTVSASEDGTLLLCGVETAPLPALGHAAGIHWVAADPALKLVVSGDRDGRVLVRSRLTPLLPQTPPAAALATHELMGLLQQSTRACIPASLRVRHLAEAEDSARSAEQRCLAWNERR